MDASRKRKFSGSSEDDNLTKLPKYREKCIFDVPRALRNNLQGKGEPRLRVDYTRTSELFKLRTNVTLSSILSRGCQEEFDEGEDGTLTEQFAFE